MGEGVLLVELPKDHHVKAIDLIRSQLQLSDMVTMRLAEDLRDAPLAQPIRTTAGTDGNHPLWCIGHHTFIESSLPSIIFGESHPLAHWAPLFATGTQPLTDPAAYPSFDEVLDAYRTARRSTFRILDRVGEAGLDQRPKNIPPGFEKIMSTIGDTILLMAFHQMSHYGQLADARRAAGRKPFN